jgi:hypothetical protein
MIAIWFALLLSFSDQAEVPGKLRVGDGEFPACHEVRISSPDHRWTLVSSTNPQFCSKWKANGDDADLALKLYLVDERLRSRRLVLEFNSDGNARWTQNSGAFFINVHVASNMSEAYLYRTDSLKKINLATAILESDPSVIMFMDGHMYVIARKWLADHTALVQLCGHTDRFPVVQFDFRYGVSLNGQVRRLSERQGPPDLTECEWEDDVGFGAASPDSNKDQIPEK